MNQESVVNGINDFFGGQAQTSGQSGNVLEISLNFNTQQGKVRAKLIIPLKTGTLQEAQQILMSKANDGWPLDFWTPSAGSSSGKHSNFFKGGGRS